MYLLFALCPFQILALLYCVVCSASPDPFWDVTTKWLDEPDSFREMVHSCRGDLEELSHQMYEAVLEREKTIRAAAKSKTLPGTRHRATKKPDTPEKRRSHTVQSFHALCYLFCAIKHLMGDTSKRNPFSQMFFFTCSLANLAHTAGKFAVYGAGPLLA